MCLESTDERTRVPELAGSGSQRDVFGALFGLVIILAAEFLLEGDFAFECLSFGIGYPRGAVTFDFLLPCG